MTVADQHALERAVHGLAVGVAHEVAARADRSIDGALGERDEQWQVQIGGEATTVPGAASVDIDFAHGFALDTGNRMSQLERPHFHCGFEVTSVSDAGGNPSATPPFLIAAVTRWAIDGVSIVGATVAIAAHAPAGPLTFRGVAHLTFQGYGVVLDPQPDQED